MITAGGSARLIRSCLQEDYSLHLIRGAYQSLSRLQNNGKTGAIDVDIKLYISMTDTGTSVECEKLKYSIAQRSCTFYCVDNCHQTSNNQLILVSAVVTSALSSCPLLWLITFAPVILTSIGQVRDSTCSYWQSLHNIAAIRCSQNALSFVRCLRISNCSKNI